MEFGDALGVVGKPSMSKDLIKKISQFLELMCARY
jgi:hypothetical protein